MVFTLLLTLIVESTILALLAYLTNRPIGSWLRTCLVMNVITQGFLWIVLSEFWFVYLPALAVAEVAIWGIESMMLFARPSNRLTLSQAAWISLVVNGASLSIGWFLPY